MKFIRHYESFSQDKTVVEVLDVFQDVVDEFGMEKYKPTDLFSMEYPDDSITYSYWISGVHRSHPLLSKHNSLRIKIVFKGNKKAMYNEVEKYTKETLQGRYHNMGLNVEFGGLSLGHIHSPDRIVTLTMNITRIS